MDLSGTILVVLPNWVGDAVMATPSLRAIRNNYSSCRIVFMGNPAVIETVFSQDLADGVVESAEKGIAATFRMAKRLRRMKFDMAILLPNSFRSAFVVYMAFVGRRVGYSRDGRGWMLTDRARPPRDDSGSLLVCPTLDYYADLLKTLSVDVDDRKMSLSVDEALAVSELEEVGAAEFEGPLVMLNPGGAFGPSKLWSAQRYGALADALVDRFGAGIIINAAPTEKDIAIAVSDAMKNKPLLNYGRRDNSISLLKSNLARCDLLVTNDTGARHIAVAVDTAVVTIYGSTDPSWTSLDYDRQENVRIDTDCGPCQQKICRLAEDEGRMQCLEGVTVQMVMEAAVRMLDVAGKAAL